MFARRGALPRGEDASANLRRRDPESRGGHFILRVAEPINCEEGVSFLKDGLF